MIHRRAAALDPARRARRSLLATSAVALALMLAPEALAQATDAPGAQAPTQIPEPIVDAEAAQALEAEAATDGDEAEVEAVVVTGTSIRGVAPAGSPVLAITQEQIQNSGATTTTELLRQLPQVFNLGASDTQFTASNNANANVTGGSGINLRGLGTEATLTLVDSRRLPAAGTMAQYFDPSVIPTGAIGRIEVLADGGSAIYGSDAVGGVVNILLRRNFQGLELSARYGFADGFDQTILGGVFGRKWSGGGLMVAVEYNERGNLLASERDFYTDDLRPFGGQDLRSFNANPGNIQVGATRYAIPAGQNGRALTAAQLSPATPNRRSAYFEGDALPAQERLTSAFTFDHDLTDRISFSAQGIFAKREFVRGAGNFTSNLVVPRSNPFFVHPTNPAAPNVTVNYSFNEDFGRSERTAESELSFLTGDFGAELGAGWEATVYASHGQDIEDSYNSAVNTAALNRALADSNPATAFNPFGDGSNTPQATLDLIEARFRIASEYTLQEYGVTANGPLFSLPGGEVRAAVGLSAQDNELISTVGGNGGTANNTVFAFTETVAQRDISSAFAELFVPIVGDANAIPGVQELSLSLAGRWDDYSDFGTTFNPKLGLVWRPTADLKLRSSYGTAFRAPSISDVNPRASLTIGVQDFVDPRSPTGQTRTLWVRGGRDGLQPEEADIWSFGGDWTPEFLSGLNLSLTYFDIEYTNRIETPGNDTTALAREAILADFIVRNPPASLTLPFLNDPLYTGTERNPANILAFVDGRKTNTGRVETNGFEFVARYEWENAWGSWRVGAVGAYLFHFRRSLTQRAPITDFVDTINNPLRFQGRGELGWEQGPFAATAYLNYVGDYNNNTLTPQQSIDAHETLDVSLRYELQDMGRLAEGVTLSLDVQNLFDSDPPTVLNGNIAFDPQTASAIGRFVLVGVRKRF